MKQDSQNNKDTHQVDILEWVLFFWKEKLIILLSVIFMVCYSFYYLKHAEYKYSISLSVVPTQSLDASQMSSSGLGILARAAGFNSNDGQGSTSDFMLYKAIIKTNIIADILSKDQSFMISIFSNEWNEGKKTWNEPTISTRNKIVNFIKNILGLPVYFPEKPNPERLFKILKDLNVTTNKETNVTTLKYLSSNPDEGKLIVEKIHNAADKVIRERALIKHQNNTHFLSQKLNDTLTHEYRLSIIQTMALEQQKLMLASSNLPYTAESFSNIKVSSRPVSPIIRNTFLIYFFSGLIIGIFLSLIKYLFVKVFY